MSSDVAQGRETVQTVLADRAASVKVLLDADFTVFDTAELLAMQSEREQHARADAAIDVRIQAALMARATPTEIGGKSWIDVLATRMRLSSSEAGRRVGLAKDLGPRHALGGEVLEPLLPRCAEALAAGTIHDGHIRVIQRTVAAAAPYLCLQDRAKLEQTLVELAEVTAPESVAKAGEYALRFLNQDGDGPDMARRKRGIQIGKQDVDGLTYISGWVDAEFAAYLGTILDVWGRYGVNNPDDEHPQHKPIPNSLEDETPAEHTGPQRPAETGREAASEPEPHREPDPPADDQLPLPTDFGTLADRFDTDVDADADADATPHPTIDNPDPEAGDRGKAAAARDSRTQAQRNHDALKVVLREILMSKKLGQHGGLPVTVVVSTTLAELEAGAGIAVTGTGTVMSIAEMMRLAEHAYHYLIVYRHHTAEPLYMGRTKRLATKAQRLLLYNRDRGCTRPGCTQCANRCQGHHARADWKDGGNTDAPDLGLGCPPDNRLVELGWRTSIDEQTGRVHWHPPPLMDTGQDTINHHFHPEELIGEVLDELLNDDDDHDRHDDQDDSG